MPRTPKVALLIETARGYGRDLLRGIVRYARLHGPWGCYVTLHAPTPPRSHAARPSGRWWE